MAVGVIVWSERRTPSCNDTEEGQVKRLMRTILGDAWITNDNQSILHSSVEKESIDKTVNHEPMYLRRSASPPPSPVTNITADLSLRLPSKISLEDDQLVLFLEPLY